MTSSLAPTEAAAPAATSPRRAAVRRLLGPPTWADLALVPLLLGAASQVRRWWFGHPFWLDEESIAVNLRDTGFVELTGRLLFSQSAPVGWLWAERASLLAFGTGERALRLLPLVFAIGTLVVFWLIARRLVGPVATVVGTTMLAASPALGRYAAELKQYSSDTFWVLVLLGLAIALAARPDRPPRYLLGWWAVAAAAGWFSMAATLATPGLALVLLVVTARAQGIRTAVRAAFLGGSVWLAAFAVHYAIALRFTTDSTFLRDFWITRGGLPPAGSDVFGRLAWLGGRPAPLGVDPLWLLDRPVMIGFWLLVGAGLAVAVYRSRPVGALLAAPVVTGVALGLAGVVPLASRLALWLVPVLWLTAAVAVDALAALALRHGRRPDGPGRAGPGTWLPAAGAAVALGVVLVGGVVALRVQVDADLERPRGPDRSDDRAAISWLQANHREGDLVVVAVESTPAARWYAPGGRLRPGWYARGVGAAVPCTPAQFPEALRGYRRVLAYAIDAGAEVATYRALDAELRRLGRPAAEQRFDLGRAWIVELDPAAVAVPVTDRPATGCLVINRI